MAEVDAAKALAAKDQGNALYKAGKNEDAVKAYEGGLPLCESSSDTALAIHKNLAAVHLKTKSYAKAIEHCDKALEIKGGDVKALYRRAQAYEATDELEKAFADVVKVTKLDKKNTAAQKMAHSLMGRCSAKRTYKTSSAGISQDILECALDGPTPEKKKQASMNLAAFAQDETGAMQLYKKGATDKLLVLLQSEDAEIVNAILHTYACIGQKSADRAIAVVKSLTSGGAQATLMSLMQSKTAKTVRASVMILNMCLEACSADTAVRPEHGQCLNTLLEYIIALLPHHSIIAEARDAAISAIVKNAKRSDVSKRFVDLGGVKAMLVLASCTRSQLDLGKAASEQAAGIDVSPEARMQCAVALAELYNATKTFKGKSKTQWTAYEPIKQHCLASLSWSKDPVLNVPTVYTLTVIIQGVIDIANEIFDSAGVMSHIMKMAQSDNQEAKCAAAEALSHAASDKKRSKEVMMKGFGILKGLYSKDLPDAIRVRALAGLCKIGSHGGGTSNLKTLADGAVVNLAKKIRPFLIGDDKPIDCKKWASEGLAYLTLDADVKEMIVGDKKIMRTVASLCTEGDPTVQYGLANMLVNITNSYDVPENTEERESMKKLGKFAGEHIPEPHELDADEYVNKRIEILVKAKMPAALVNLCKTESDRAREQISRVFLAMVTEVPHRGLIIAQGGAKALVGLFGKNTDKGKLKAAQALAKIAITADPKLAFAGQRAAELVRPLVFMLKSDKPLHNFEGCMALTNLAGLDDELRMRIVREEGVKHLQDLMFDDDWRIRRVATECLCNMMYCEKVFEMYALKDGLMWERVKMWILFAGCANEDFEAARAASGGLAILSSSPDVCERITEEKQGMSILREIAACGNQELQTRGLHTISNISRQSKKLAQIVADDQGLELLSALCLTTKEKAIEKYCTGILENLVKFGIIEDIDEAHTKARACAAETIASFAREEEEEDEDEDEDEDEVQPGDVGSGLQEPIVQMPENLDLSWPQPSNEDAEPKIEEVKEEADVAVMPASGDVMLEEKVIEKNTKDPLNSVVGSLPGDSSGLEGKDTAPPPKKAPNPVLGDDYIEVGGKDAEGGDAPADVAAKKDAPADKAGGGGDSK